MKNFWQELKKPLFVLAPMADVTDAAFRRVIAKYGKPDVMWTEFVSADGLIRATPEGKKKLMLDLIYTAAERPIVAQLFTSNPDIMRQAAKLVQDLGFDGLDINMGCPDRSIEKQGAGAALIKNSKRAREVLRAAKEGAPNIPVSVKTRIGYNKNELETWLPELLAEEPAVITVHARTRKEMSKVSARWEHVKRAVEIRNELKSKTLIFGNGDVADLEDARKKVEETGADGVMLGRAIFGNPWLFASLAHAKHDHQTERLVVASAKADITIPAKLNVLVEHTYLFEELLGDAKNFAIMKKHYKAYVAGFEGAGELRNELFLANDAKEVQTIVETFLKNTKF
jgi:nifR3 family TIM-barrel protein